MTFIATLLSYASDSSCTEETTRGAAVRREGGGTEGEREAEREGRKKQDKVRRNERSCIG